jgi:nucleotide-binding universal stress UspA family protein
VLACIDGSTYTDAVVDYAAWVSRVIHNPLRLLHNLDQTYTPPHDLSGSIGLGTREALLTELTELEGRRNRIQMENGKQLLDQACQRAVAHEAFDVSIQQQHGSLIESLIEMEDEIRVLVLGVRGEGHENKQNQIGAQLEMIVRSMHRPVLVVNRAFSKAPQEIMLAYDGSEAAGKALEMVATSPLYKGMRCHLVHVAKEAVDDSELLQQAAQPLRNAGFEMVTASLHGDVDQALQAYQQEHNIEMTVMGAFGHSRLRELIFGSVTVKMLCASQVPLLLLR